MKLQHHASLKRACGPAEWPRIRGLLEERGMNFAFWHTHFATATQGDPDAFDNMLQLCETFGSGVLTTTSHNVRSWVSRQDHCARHKPNEDNCAVLSHRNGDLRALIEMGWHHVSNVTLGSLSRSLHWDVRCVGADATFSISYWWEAEFTCTAFGHARVITNHAERHAFFRDALATVYAQIVDGLQNTPEQF